MIEYNWNELRKNLDKLINTKHLELREGYYGDMWHGDGDLGNDIISVIRKHFLGKGA